ncbi:MAG: histidine kinase dimerization/phospho-acceptor domain-containing protein [Chryseolinea sp.]
MTETILNFVYQPLREIDGTVSGIIVVANEITDLIRANSEQLEQEVAKRIEDLKHSNIELQKKNTELQQFAFITSHDLQEPLRKIRMFVNRSVENVDDKTALTKYLGKVELSTERMSLLIKDILDYSRLSSNRDTFFSTVDLNQILAAVKLDFEHLIEEKFAVINSEKFPIIKAIPFQMSQLFSNLISNALKFSKIKPVIISTPG